MPERLAGLRLCFHRINRMAGWNCSREDVAFPPLRGKRASYRARAQRTTTEHRRKMIGNEKRFHGLAQLSRELIWSASPLAMAPQITVKSSSVSFVWEGNMTPRRDASSVTGR